MKEIIQQVAETRADVRNLTYEIGNMQKGLAVRLDKIEKQLEDQRVADVKRDVETAASTTKINLIWEWFWGKNGYVVIGVLAYVVLGRVL